MPGEKSHDDFLGGYLEYPSNGLIGVAGYASAIMRAALLHWEGFTAPGRLSSPALQIVVLAVLAGFFTFAPAATWVFVVGVALAGIGALIFGRRASDSKADAPVAA